MNQDGHQHPKRLRDTLPPIQAWCLEHVGEVLPVTPAKDYDRVELWDDRAVQVIPNTGERADGMGEGTDVSWRSREHEPVPNPLCPPGWPNGVHEQREGRHDADLDGVLRGTVVGEAASHGSTDGATRQ